MFYRAAQRETRLLFFFYLHVEKCKRWDSWPEQGHRGSSRALVISPRTKWNHFKIVLRKNASWSALFQPHELHTSLAAGMSHIKMTAAIWTGFFFFFPVATYLLFLLLASGTERESQDISDIKGFPCVLPRLGRWRRAWWTESPGRR